GHIRRRGAHSWELKYDIERASGQRQTRYKAVRGSRREAQAELARVLAAVADNEHVDPNTLTVTALLRERMKVWQGTGEISPRTAQGYTDLIEGYILGGALVQKLSTRDIEMWHATLLSKGRRGRNGRPDGEGGVSARTCGHAHRVLSKALAEAVRHGLL